VVLVLFPKDERYRENETRNNNGTWKRVNLRMMRTADERGAFHKAIHYIPISMGIFQKRT